MIGGLPSARARAIEAEKIVLWAFRQFSMKTLREPGDVVSRVPVWMGKQRSVDITVAEPLNLLMPVVGARDYSTTLIYDGPIEAPIATGDNIGALLVQMPGLPDHKIPLVAAHDVGRGGFVIRLRTAAGVLWNRMTNSSGAGSP